MSNNHLAHRVAVGSALLCAAFVGGSARGAASAPAQGGAAGYCLAFNGIDDFVFVARSAALEPDEITVEMWARLDGPQDWNSRLLRKGEHDAYFITADQDFDQRMQLLITRDTTVQFSAEDTQPHTAYVGSWHHFAGVYATDHAEFWVDGVQVSNVNHGLGALTHLPLTDLYIGAGLPVTLQNEYFAGRIDEVRIWNYPRTAAEIQANWNRILSGTEPGLVAYWRFDEGSGQVAHDSSLLGHDGRLGATALAESSDPIWVVSDAPLGAGECSALNYCVPASNSTGHPAWMGYSGSLSLSDNNAYVDVFGVPPGRTGIFFYGRDTIHTPMGDGFLCVSPFHPGLFRLRPALTVDAAGFAQRLLDFDSLPPHGEITPGSPCYFQFWFRDPLGGSTGVNFSDGLALTLCP